MTLIIHQKAHANQVCVIPYIYMLKLLDVGTMAEFYLIVATLHCSLTSY